MKATIFTCGSVLLCWTLPSGCNGWSNSEFGVSRRQVVATGVGGILGATIEPHASQAAAPVNPAEAVRRGAANIPGYGQTDVFYPESFAGNWKAVRELQPSGLTLIYPVRFLPSIEDNAVIADRGWNQANLEKQILLMKSTEDSEASSLPSYQWVETNPNDLRLKFADGKVKDIKVTKRTTEKTGDTVFSSEFQRVTQDDARGIPIITARRVMTKWMVVDASSIEGIEVVYEVGGGDPLGSPTSGGGDQRKVLSRSRIRLERR